LFFTVVLVVSESAQALSPGRIGGDDPATNSTRRLVLAAKDVVVGREIVVTDLQAGISHRDRVPGEMVSE
jgi:hypothetical protein